MLSEANGRSEQRRRNLAETWAAHGGLLRRLAHNILRNAHAAEDACQQAFVKACQADLEAESPALLRSWLAKVVVNESLQMLRRADVERRYRERFTPLERGAAGADGELRETVMAAMSQLPETERVVVLLRVMQGMSGNEVKDLLGCSAAEVSRRLYKGMEHLRELLADRRMELVGEGGDGR